MALCAPPEYFHVTFSNIMSYSDEAADVPNPYSLAKLLQIISVHQSVIDTKAAGLVCEILLEHWCTV